jgi:hypothetical protein
MALDRFKSQKINRIRALVFKSHMRQHILLVLLTLIFSLVYLPFYQAFPLRKYVFLI